MNLSQSLIQLAAGAVGSIGFGLIFNLRRKYLIYAAAGGFLGWAVYLIASQHLWEGIFLPTLAAAFMTAIYAEILARVCKAPSTLFFMTGVIPLIPGSTLYYCIYALVTEDPAGAQTYGIQTFLFAIAIAAGMSIAWTICDFSRKLRAAWRKNRGKA